MFTALKLLRYSILASSEQRAIVAFVAIALQK
jgi:hypothetical protein